MGVPLASLAARASDDAFFLGAALAAYAASEGLDEAGLAAVLGCSARALTLLRLCRRPHPEPPAFGRDILRIAQRFGADPTALAMAVRRADALDALRQGSDRSAGTLIAARDRAGPTARGTGDAAGRDGGASSGQGADDAETRVEDDAVGRSAAEPRRPEEGEFRGSGAEGRS